MTTSSPRSAPSSAAGAAPVPAPQRVAVAGATGLTGRHVVDALRQMGHEPVSISRASGVDVLTGAGLDAALADVDAVIDVLNGPVADAGAARTFFGVTSERLLAAEQRAGVGHHVLLSIVGIDRVDGNAHYAGKRHQEEIVKRGPVPYTILRATQFHDFASMVVSWTRKDGAAVVPPLLVQPVAVDDVAHALAEVAVAPARRATIDLAGPQPQDLVDMARRTLARRGDEVTLIPSWRDGPFGVEMAGEVLLPGPDAWLATTTFETWLDEHADVPIAAAR